MVSKCVIAIVVLVIIGSTMAIAGDVLRCFYRIYNVGCASTYALKRNSFEDCYNNKSIFRATCYKVGTGFHTPCDSNRYMYAGVRDYVIWNERGTMFKIKVYTHSLISINVRFFVVVYIHIKYWNFPSYVKTKRSLSEKFHGILKESPFFCYLQALRELRTWH